MGVEFVEGVGYLAFDDNKSPEQVAAEKQYWQQTTPQPREEGVIASPVAGFSDVDSIIWNAFEDKFLLTDDEEKRKWFKYNMEQFGSSIGYTDSIALENYYSTLEKSQPLTEEEKESRAANNATMREFENDMYDAYDNKNQDITEVQKKYGYTPDDVDVIDGIIEMAKNPGYTLGALAGMVVKDPELLLISYLRIPGMIEKGTQAALKAQKMAKLAKNVKPQYIKRFESILGRGLEGATYGAAYEGLHDLTFKGYLDGDNVRKGAAMGGLLGTFFGAVNKTGYETGPSVIQKMLSKKAESDLSKGQGPVRMKYGDTIENLRTFEPVKKPTTKAPETPKGGESFGKTFDDSVALPKGLDHTKRYNFWENKVIENTKKIREEQMIQSNTGLGVAVETQKVLEESIKRAMAKGADNLQNKNKGMSREEALGLSARNIAKERFENPQSKIFETERANYQNNWSKFSQELEKGRGKQARLKGEETEAPASYETVFREEALTPATRATGMQIGKAAAIGAVGGAVLFEDDPFIGAMLGALALGGGRAVLKSQNINALKLKKKSYDVFADAKKGRDIMEAEGASLVKAIKREFPDKESRRDFVLLLEKKPKDKQLAKEYDQAKTRITPDQKELVDVWRKLLEKMKSKAIRRDIFDEGVAETYVTHIFKDKITQGQFKDAVALVTEQLSRKSGYGNQRKLEGTVLELAKKYNIETDPIEILGAYMKSMGKAIMGAEIVNVLKKTGIAYGDNQTMGLIVPKTEKATIEMARRNGYREASHPALRDTLIHPLVKKSLEDIFKIETGNVAFADKILNFNNMLKRLAVTFSFFHAQALLLSGLYSGALPVFGEGSVLTKAGRLQAKERLQRVRSLMEGRIKDGEFVEHQILKEIGGRVPTGKMKTDVLVQPGYKQGKRVVDAIGLGKVQDFIDFWTWDMIHDYGKVFAYLTAKDRAYATNRKLASQRKPQIPESEIQTRAAKYVNNAFGGQKWEQLSAEFAQKAIDNANNPKGALYDLAATLSTPSKLKWANLGIFAPDWTISNFRVAFKGFGILKDATVNKIKTGKKLNPAEMYEARLYFDYLARAGIYTTMLAYGLYNAFADEDEVPFDIEDFWKTGRLKLGDREEMVVSKQIAEPFHWLTSPQHTAWNKSGSLYKALVEFGMGKEYISFKHGGAVGPTLDRGNPREIAAWAGGKFMPISASPLATAIRESAEGKEVDWGNVGIRTLSGSAGFPVYTTGRKKYPAGI